MAESRSHTSEGPCNCWACAIKMNRNVNGKLSLGIIDYLDQYIRNMYKSVV